MSLEVVVLTLQHMLQEGGAAEATFDHAERAALNTVLGAMEEGKRLAHKLAHASSQEGQQRLYLGHVLGALDALEPGAMLPIPCSVGGEPTFMLVRRGTGAEADECTVAVVSCCADAMKYHRCEAAPPKIRLETCLELRGVLRSRLLDEALWAFVWFAGSVCQHDGKLSPSRVFYHVVLSFLVDSPLEQALLRSDELRNAEGAQLPMRTPRRSKSAHYGCCRHAINYMLCALGVPAPACKRISLALRSTMLSLAHHDLAFVRHVSKAERTLLGLACRQLAYKAAKQSPCNPVEGHSAVDGSGSGDGRGGARQGGPQIRLSDVRQAIGALNARLEAVPGIEPEATAPPPLILCKADAHLGRPPLSSLLGLDGCADGEGGRLLPPLSTASAARGAAGCAAESAPSIAPSIANAEVVGLYFSAGWCPACKTATPLIADAYRQIQGRGKALEVVFVSLDKSADDFDATRATMPWPALPHSGTRSALLAELFQVRAVPTLVFLRPDGSLVSTDGVRLLRKHARKFPWVGQAPPPETPHHLPLHERLLRPHPVDAGLAHELPGYLPVDFLQLPTHVTTLLEAIDTVRLCDKLATLVSVQSHSVKNTPHLVCVLIQHTFTQLLPMPRPEGSSEAATACVWRSPMDYADQLDLLLLLQRIMEHFSAAVFSLDHTRSLDGVRMVVPWCIAAIADVVMRTVATDIASEACVHLSGFALSTAALARQSATVWVHTAELNTARCGALDYFAALDHLPKIFEWHKSDRLDPSTAAYLKATCGDVAFPTGQHLLYSYVVDTHALIMKNYPELQAYRDIAFYAKLFLNPDIRRFPAKNRWVQRDAELAFELSQDNSGAPLFIVKAFQGHGLVCRPKVKRGEMPPTHRFSTLSSSSEYTRPYVVDNEDDVLHMWELPDFATSGGVGALGQHDSELLLSYLTVPYRAPPPLRANPSQAAPLPCRPANAPAPCNLRDTATCPFATRGALLA